MAGDSAVDCDVFGFWCGVCFRFWYEDYSFAEAVCSRYFPCVEVPSGCSVADVVVLCPFGEFHVISVP